MTIYGTRWLKMHPVFFYLGGCNTKSEVVITIGEGTFIDDLFVVVINLRLFF